MKKKGFVVSAILYPLLVLFLALIMGMLSMTDTRKRILDRMKLEIEDSIFDDETCSCDTILNKLNYLIKNGVGGGGASGSYTFNMLTLRVKGYPSVSDFPNRDNAIGDIAVVTEVEIPDYFISQTPPNEPKEGSIWIVQDIDSPYFVESDYSRIGINYAMQYIHGEWCIVKTYVFMDNSWTLLYYVPVDGTHVDLTGTDINAETSWTYSHTGSYQTFHARFSGMYEVHLWGAQGTGAYYGGGAGAYTGGRIYLNAGDILYVYVGGAGSGGTGGFNGGASGGYGGGGATDLRLVSNLKDTSKTEFESLRSRIMVAGGGGGSYNYKDGSNYYYAAGGGGGAYEGFRGNISWTSNNSSWNKYMYRYYGVGGTQSRPGYFSTSNGSADAALGKGGIGNYASGGGGYYGGGGSVSYGAAGGGSSYISGHPGCSSISEDSISSNITHTGSAFHYSGYYFVDTKMVDGSGYEWNITRSSTNGKMPTQNLSSTMNGNGGNGYARIKMLTVEVKEKSELESYIDEKDVDFNYMYNGTDSVKGKHQIFTAPKNGYYEVELRGAQGGSYSPSYPGGYGGYTKGEIYLNKGTKLYVYAGSTPSGQANGGWNGGGNAAGGDNGYSFSTGGGGSTDLRLVPTSELYEDFESLKTRIMVAGGGGGSTGYWDGNNYMMSNGGHGGGLSGSLADWTSNNSGWNNSYAPGRGTGGTQVLGGYVSNSSSNVATFGNGGKGISSYSSGGGAGWYGGGGASSYAGAGGGSSYISGHEGCSSINEDSTSDSIIHNGDATHYSGYYFLETSMSGANNTGDGRVRIKLISSENKTEDQLNIIKASILNNWSYPYIGINVNHSSSRYQTFTAPKNGVYKIDMCGARGGNTASADGGKGGCTSGKITLEKGEKFYIFVGGAPNGGGSGGWNGGGTSTIYGAGGGSTDIRLSVADTSTQWNNFDSLKTRIMVAAGGGGGMTYKDGSNYMYSTGGYGGGLIGGNGSNFSSNTSSWNLAYVLAYGTGATQGRPGSYNQGYNTYLGGFGYGGTGGTGGGSGYYGGGGGTNYNSAGGGSSYISGYTGSSAILKNSTEDEILHTGSSYHYSGYYFTETSMSANANNSHGYVTIKYMSDSYKTKAELDTYRVAHDLTFHFSYSGKNTKEGTYQIFEVPKTGNYKIELWGAQGGDYNPSYRGGLGGYTRGKIYLVKGTKLYLYIGPWGASNKTAIWNGGGTASGTGGSGGGSTDIRTKTGSNYDVWDNPASLASRIMVAGAGGGAYGYYDGSNYMYSPGGTGGGLTGFMAGWTSNTSSWNSSYSPRRGTGASQVAPGYCNNETSQKGGFGFGASLAAGGGAGWFGGGPGNTYAGGGGGSSYVSGHKGCVGVDEDGNLNSSAYTTYSDSVSWTNYAFTETTIIDGEGYEWDTGRITNTRPYMPTYDGTTTMTGNSGDGHAKITYIGG